MVVSDKQPITVPCSLPLKTRRGHAAYSCKYGVYTIYDASLLRISDRGMERKPPSGTNAVQRAPQNHGLAIAARNGGLYPKGRPGDQKAAETKSWRVGTLDA